MVGALSLQFLDARAQMFHHRVLLELAAYGSMYAAEGGNHSLRRPSLETTDARSVTSPVMRRPVEGYD
jgi:hypothetical protein